MKTQIVWKLFKKKNSREKLILLMGVHVSCVFKTAICSFKKEVIYS